MPKAQVNQKSNIKRERFLATEDCKCCHRRCFDVHPKAKQWSSKNQKTAHEVALNDNRKYWFNCEKCPHDFESSPGKVTQGRWCPYCSNRCRCPPDTIESCVLCWERCFASHPKKICWSDRNEKRAEEVALNDHRKYWFNCDKCPHAFEAPVSTVNKGHWCPYCVNRDRCPPDTIESCVLCWEGCFASHPKKIYWSDRNEKRAEEVALNDNRKYWFDCDKCPHDFESTPSYVTQGSWCPYCANLNRCPPETIESCVQCWAGCFASHAKRICWSDRNEKAPEEVALNDHRKYWFNCDKCLHEFESSLHNVSRGKWCPFCPNRKRCHLDTIESCIQCMKGTFASHPKKTCWSERNEKRPYEVALNDNRKFWFDCDKCSHNFEASPNKVTGGRWCPYCKYKTEALVFGWCLEWDLTAIRGVRFEWCISESTNRAYPFDIFCPTFGVLVEVDGCQHFRNVANWGDNVAERQMRDVYKMQGAVQNDLRVIRIRQADIWKNQSGWKLRLYKSVADCNRRVIMLADDPSIYDDHWRLADFV